MTDTMYRSTKSVPDRVDAAWHQGFVAGQRDARRLAGLAFVVAAFVELRRHRFPILPCCLIAVAVALAIVPAVLAVLAARAAWRIHQRRRSGGPASLVTLSDGTTF